METNNTPPSADQRTEGSLKQDCSATTVYDPVKSLREEVERFKATNLFTPMLVTHFYAQAACVLSELERAREENARLTTRIANLKVQLSDAVW